MKTIEIKTTSDWLKALGAKRPMAPACDQILVLGDWVAGFYPIEWMVAYDWISRDFNGNLMNPLPMEQWRVFGHETKYPLTEDDCKWILANVGKAKP